MALQLSHTTVNALDAYRQSVWWADLLGYHEDPEDPNEPGHEECMIFSPDESHRDPLHRRARREAGPQPRPLRPAAPPTDRGTRRSSGSLGPRRVRRAGLPHRRRPRVGRHGRPRGQRVLHPAQRRRAPRGGRPLTPQGSHADDRRGRPAVAWVRRWAGDRRPIDAPLRPRRCSPRSAVPGSSGRACASTAAGSGSAPGSSRSASTASSPPSSPTPTSAGSSRPTAASSWPARWPGGWSSTASAPTATTSPGRCSVSSGSPSSCMRRAPG